ncbi:GumC family protein [Anatilimnocola floriformis]|uniref:GumC family protein n=1 Tax=Anatilimnocola floriformis TaxID=2948575 RepID=UPI0020C3B0A7|nr:hypothetical protein [Anatilimnocola floriformis]
MINTFWQPLLRIANRMKWPMLVVWLVVVVVGYIGLKFTPSVFRSEGKLLVRLGRENVSVDPTANLGNGQITAVPVTRELELNTVVETLRGRSLLERVVDEVGPETILRDQFHWSEAILPQRLSPRERALAKLTKMIDVAVVRKSSMVKVACDARDAKLARRCATLFIDSFLSHHRQLNRNPAAHGFFAEQTRVALESLKGAEEKYLQFKNETDVVSIEEQKRLLLGTCDQLSREVQTARTEYGEAQAAIEGLRKHLKSIPERHATVTTRGLSNQAADSIRDQLYTLQLREQELSSKFTDNDIRLQQVREQIKSAEKIYRSEARDRSTTEEGRSRAYEEAEILLVNRETAARALTARIASREPQLAAAQARLQTLNNAESQHERLVREVDIQRETYLRYAQSLEQARIDELLATQRITNISIADEPSLNNKSVFPNRPVIVTVIIICATFLAAAFGMAWDQISPPPQRQASFDSLSSVHLSTLHPEPTAFRSSDVLC